MLNSMSVCKLHMLHDQEDLIGSEYSKLQRLELVTSPERWPLRGYPFPCKNVLIILTEFWLGVAG